jgi:type III pantothenate kinase
MSLLLAVDVGNTNIVLGIYDVLKGSKAPLEASWRMTTSRDRTADEYGVCSLELLASQGIAAKDISYVVVSNVVSAMHTMLISWLTSYFRTAEYLSVDFDVETGLVIKIDNPRELGSDRIVNAVAGVELYGAPLIIVDFGTATSFDVINGSHEYLGGVICPGLNISAEALFQRAPRLPRVEIVEPECLVGKNTVQAMQSGLYYGYIGLVDGVLARLLDICPASNIIATGGLATVVAPASKYIKHIACDMILRGLYIIWLKNRRP